MKELPHELQSFLFSELKAFYRKGDNFDINLNNDEVANRQYLGTYFPRSFIESYNIFFELFQNPLIKDSLLSKPVLRILDIGAGTGGNMFGLIYYLKKSGYKGDIWFYTLDGNQIAINYQRKIYNFFCKTLLMSYHLRYKEIVLNPMRINQQIAETLYHVDFKKFDIITSFKFISEFYFDNYNFATGSFNKLLKGIENHLAHNSIFLLLDIVAGPTDHSKNFFMSREMSKEINHYVKEDNSSLSYILPVSCGIWSDKCRIKNCYTERIFEVTHDHALFDISKVCYRVLAPKNYARDVLTYHHKKESYQISYNKKNPKKCNLARISKLEKQESPANGYFLQ